MKNLSAKFMLLVLALTLAVPESYAKRMGSGRSSGRQTSIARQRTLPSTPPASRPQPAPSPAIPSAPARPQGDYARQPLPPGRPVQPPRQASSPWGGMLGGALLGLGLGSLMSSGDRHANGANQSPGTNGDGTAVPENQAGSEERTNQAQPARQDSEHRSGSLLLPIVLALAAFFVIRRLIARGRRRHY